MTVLALLALLLQALVLHLVWGQCASGNKDPHLDFAHGGRADFRGRDKTYYCFFSGPKLSVNVLIEDATFVINDDKGSLTVDGTYITQVHINATVGGVKQKPMTLSVSREPTVALATSCSGCGGSGQPHTQKSSARSSAVAQGSTSSGSEDSSSGAISSTTAAAASAPAPTPTDRCGRAS